METPGTVKTVLGAILLICVAIVFLGAHIRSPGALAVVYFAMMGGGLLMCIGLHQWDNHNERRWERRTKPLSGGRLETLLQAMVAMALVDGRLHDSEVDIIAHAYKQVSGRQISSEEIARRAKYMKRTGFDMCHELGQKRKQIDDNLRAMIIRGCGLVMKIDNEVEPSELAHMNKMAGVLGLTEQQWNALVADFLPTILSEGADGTDHSALPSSRVFKDLSGDRLEILLQAMIAMALVDGRLDDSEVDIIVRRHKALSGQQISPEEIANKAAEMQRIGFDLCREIREKLGLFDADLMYMIVRGCVFVLAHDNRIERPQIALMKEITGVLGLTEQQWVGMVSDMIRITPSR